MPAGATAPLWPPLRRDITAWPVGPAAGHFRCRHGGRGAQVVALVEGSPCPRWQAAGGSALAGRMHGVGDSWVGSLRGQVAWQRVRFLSGAIHPGAAAGVSLHEGGGRKGPRRTDSVGVAEASVAWRHHPSAEGMDKLPAHGSRRESRECGPAPWACRAWARRRGPDVAHAWGDGTAAPPHAAGPSVPGFLCRALPGAPGWSCICHSQGSRRVHIGRGWGDDNGLGAISRPWKTAL